MEWIDTLFVEHTALQAVVVVALICAAGMALGKVRILSLIHISEPTRP